MLPFWVRVSERVTSYEPRTKKTSIQLAAEVLVVHKPWLGAALGGACSWHSSKLPMHV